MSINVLLVDDSSTLRGMVAQALLRHDMQPIEAADGVEGLARLREGGVDCVILDVNMPTRMVSIC